MIEQLIEIVDKIDLNKIGIKDKLEKEIKRMNEFQNKIMGVAEPQIENKNIDIRAYVKYILRSGTLQEKRELMQSFKSKIIVLNKKIILE